MARKQMAATMQVLVFKFEFRHLRPALARTKHQRLAVKFLRMVLLNLVFSKTAIQIMISATHTGSLAVVLISQMYILGSGARHTVLLLAH